VEGALSPQVESPFTTAISSHDLHHIWVRGHDLTRDVIGKMSFTEVVSLLVLGRLPEPAELRLLDAVLVTLVEHGLTPSAAVARVTYAVAPEAIQGAIAAGLLGAGSVVLGSMEDCGRLLSQVAAETPGDPDAIRKLVLDYRRQGRHLPGIGHAIHTEGDPRSARLYEVAEACGRRGVHLGHLEDVSRIASEVAGRPLPINATGAIAAILLELGVPWQLHRGFALISRTAGLLGHIGEERTAPITPQLRQLLRANDG
jgi:citrate synthase